jgi:IS4 transposase
LPASAVAAVYKDRWQTELFFKAIKQNLKIKRFYGNSRNAVLTQIWTALTVYLLYYLLKAQTKNGGAFIYQFHIGNTNNAVSKNKPDRMTHRSIAPIEESRQNLFRPAGVCMVNRGIILDTNETR